MNEKKKEKEEPAFVFMQRELISYDKLREAVKKFLEEKKVLFEQYPDLKNSSFIAYMIFKPDSLSRMIRGIMEDLSEVHIK